MHECELSAKLYELRSFLGLLRLEFQARRDRMGDLNLEAAQLQVNAVLERMERRASEAPKQVVMFG